MKDTFDHHIRIASDKHGVPFNIVKAVIWQESGFRPEAVSSCGAVGLMQLMPVTAIEMGLAQHDFADPEFNIDGGTKYLRILWDRFPEIPGTAERWKFALASYNGGRGHINKALKVARDDLGEKRWWKWEVAKSCLTGCDEHQIIHYVDGVFTKFMDLVLDEKPRPTRGCLYSLLMRLGRRSGGRH